MARLTNHARTTRTLLTTLRDQGMTLEQCAGPKIMARSIRTLQRWAKRLDIAFPDYQPKAKKAPPQMTQHEFANLIHRIATSDITLVVAGIIALILIGIAASEPTYISQ